MISSLKDLKNIVIHENLVFESFHTQIAAFKLSSWRALDFPAM